MAHEGFDDLVVIIPGILGSRLARKLGDQHVTVFDFSLGALAKTLRTLATEGIALAGDGIDPPDDGIGAVGLFNYQLLPGFFGVDDYSPLIDAITGSLGARRVLCYPYDWRLSNRHAAQGLRRVALDALARWRNESGNARAKLWLVCHSMGGLVARYFCEKLGGGEETRAIVTIGTPHRGSVRALDALVNGMRFGPFNVTDLVRSFPSVYELLPLFPVLRHPSGEAIEMVRIASLFGLDHITGEDIPGWQDPVASGHPAPLPGIDRAMLKRALEFHAAIRQPAEQRAEAKILSPYDQQAFFNRRQPTLLSAQYDGNKLKVYKTYPEQRSGRWVEDDARGDGTVPSFASVPIEWEDTKAAVPLGQMHTAMQTEPSLLAALQHWFNPQDVSAKKGGGHAALVGNRGPAGTPDSEVVALDAPTVVELGEPLVVATAAERPVDGFVELVDIATGAKASAPMLLPGRDTPWKSVFHPRTSGVYRITARPRDRRLPAISDYVYVTERSTANAL